MCIRILILVSLAFLMILLFIGNENFNDMSPIKMHRCFKPNIAENKIFNQDAYINNNWHLRFPELVKRRYSFDEINANFDFILNESVEYAPLNKLAVDIKKEL